MNIGTRITQRLKALNWERRDLLDRVYGLSAQALSNLIRRGSKRSEWDEQIAAALDVSVLWLVYGKDEHTAQGAKQDFDTYIAATVFPKSKREHLSDKISLALENINEDGLLVAIGRIETLVEEYPRKAKQTPSS